MEQPLGEHGDYMQELFDSNKLIIGGPYLDDQGGMAIIEAADEEEAANILNNDPAIIDQFFKADIHPLLAVFDLMSGASLRSESD